VLTENENKLTAKGCQKQVLKKYITHKHYQNCLNNILYYVENRRIQSKSHEIHSVKINKLIYTPFCDKRFILDDGFSTLAFGHKDCYLYT
jgi:hypothetical protein